MRRSLFIALALLASCAMWFPHKVLSADAKGPTTGTLGALGNAVTAFCPGYSTADIYVPAGMVGTVTAYVGPNTGSFANPVPGPTSAPAAAIPNPATLSSFPGHLYVAIASASYVSAVVTAYTSGSATASILCSAAALPVSGGGTVTQGTSPWVVNTPVPAPFTFDTSSELYVNTNGSNVNVLNVPPPIPTPPTTGVLPTPAAPVYNFSMGQYSSPLPAPAAGYEGLLQTDNHSILYTHPYSAGPCGDPTIAQSYAQVALSTAGSATLIATSPNTVVAHICSLTIAVSAASTVSMGYSNVANNCTAPTNIVSYPLQSGLVKTPPRELYPGMWSAGQYVCVSSSAAVNTTVDVTYVLQ